MPSPIITFRLTHYQLARGLQVVRKLEPNFHLTSLSQLVKIIYTDYLAKMTLGQSDEIDSKIINDINIFLLTPKRKEINLESLADEENLIPSVKAKNTEPKVSTESKISTVTDFSPPKNWIDQEI